MATWPRRSPVPRAWRSACRACIPLASGPTGTREGAKYHQGVDTVKSVDDVRDALARARLPRRRGPGDCHLPRAVPAAPAPARGRGRRRQDRGRQGAGPLDRRRAHPPPVLRGDRRLPGRLRVGLLPPAPAPPGGRGRGRPGRGGRALLRAVPRPPPAAAGDRAPRGASRRSSSSTRSTGPTTSSRPSCSRSSPTTRSRCPSSAPSAPRRRRSSSSRRTARATSTTR